MNTLFKLPELDVNELTLITTHGYYDGPTCGIAEWRGRRFYFNWFEEENLNNAWDDRRYFALYEMNDQQVVWFTSMDDYWEFLGSVVVDHDVFMDKFYTKYPVKNWPKFSNDQAVAWFYGW